MPPRAWPRTIHSMSAHALERLARRWQLSLDAADRALRAAADTLPAPYLQLHSRALVEERRETAELLVTLARVEGIRRRSRTASIRPR